mmetsp:Transcript_39102/g.91917  ORF Transcript_39102/g.91917 Transcript_39102/m.91917 type:complete len:152 (-) Transcript_39102:302-757(-)
MQVTIPPNDPDWSWTQAEFLLSGHSMPRTPDGAPLEWHASFLPLDDKFTLGADEPHSKPCSGCVPPPPSPSKPLPASSLRALTTLPEWHVFGSGEVPLVRQHSQELQCLVQTAFDEMEAALALGQIAQRPRQDDAERRETSAVPFTRSMRS